MKKENLPLMIACLVSAVSLFTFFSPLGPLTPSGRIELGPIFQKINHERRIKLVKKYSSDDLDNETRKKIRDCKIESISFGPYVPGAFVSEKVISAEKMRIIDLDMITYPMEIIFKEFPLLMKNDSNNKAPGFEYAHRDYIEWTKKEWGENEFPQKQ